MGLGAVSTRHEGAESATGKKSILMIDDSAELRAVLKEILEGEGYEVHSAADGGIALTMLGRIPRPCLVLLDLNMPGMNGWQFLAARRADVELPAIPVVILTGGEKLPSWAADVAGIVRKPIDVTSLLAICKQFCSAA